MGHIFGRTAHAMTPFVAGGQGCYLIDANGKQYLDGSGGAAVSCLGHGDREIIEAIKAQLDKVAYAHTSYFTCEPAEELAEMLAASAPGTLDRVYLVSGGSEAMEAAIKLARQYQIKNGEPTRHRIIARRQSYHGNTLGALAAGGNEQRKAPFAPMLAQTSQIAPCYEYRGRAEDETRQAYGIRVADELQAEIERLGPANVLAFIAEPVVGATSGAVASVPGYFKRIREICDRYGVLLILDEVMCGMGRTGTLFAFEQDGVVPDIVTVAKGLGGGYVPIGAMICTSEIYDVISSESGFFQHGHTYMGHPVSAAGARAVLNAIQQRQLLPRVVEMGELLDRKLNAAFGQHPHVGDVRGRGLFRAIELVKDRETKQPFEMELSIAAKLKAAAFEAGLICYPMNGTIDGRLGDHVLLAPPFIIDEMQLDELVDRLSVALSRVLPVSVSM